MTLLGVGAVALTSRLVFDVRLIVKHDAFAVFAGHYWYSLCAGSK